MYQAMQQFSCERGHDRKDTTETMVERGNAGWQGASVRVGSVPIQVVLREKRGSHKGCPYSVPEPNHLICNATVSGEDYCKGPGNPLH